MRPIPGFNALRQQLRLNCHSNLTPAVVPYGLAEFDVHDVMNVSQCTLLIADGKYFLQPCPAKAGGYFELFAEIHVLCALSTCSGGDLSAWGWDQDGDMLKCCRPLGVQFYHISDQKVVEGWEPPKPHLLEYQGHHGIVIPTGEAQTQR